MALGDVDKSANEGKEDNTKRERKDKTTQKGTVFTALRNLNKEAKAEGLQKKLGAHQISRGKPRDGVLTT